MSFPDLTTYLSSEDSDHPASEGYGAIILYDHRPSDTGAVITTDSEAAGFEAVQLFNWRPTNSWKPAASGTHHVDTTLTGTATADCFAFARYALGDVDATIVLRTSPDGATWTDCFPAIRLGDWNGRPKMIAFPVKTSARWRVEVVSAAAPSAVAVVAFGMAYWPKYAQLVGFRLFLTARKVAQYTATSEEGLMLGRTKLRVLTESSLTFDHMTETELEDEWAPFALHAEGTPFFVAPLITAFPNEVGYMELDGALPVPAYSRHRRFTVTIPMQGGCAVTYATELLRLGKQAVHMVEIDLDFCTRSYGVAPCTAAIGTTGSQECWNTRKTCQDKTNYATTAKTYRFSNTLLPMSRDLAFQALNCVLSVSLTPSRITPGKGLGKRASVVVECQDFAHSDLGLDPYLANRSYTEGQSRTQGTYFTKLLARNPYYQGRPMRVRTGYVVEGQEPDAANFEDRLYLIERIDGPDSKGRVKITAKDPLKMLDNARAKAPSASTGKLLADINAVAGTLTLTPAGVGNLEYAASGKVCIGEEVIAFSRVADVMTLTRARNTTVAEAHEADEPVQECLAYEDATITAVLNDLLVTRAGIPAGYVDLPTWELEQADWLRDYLLNTVVTEPTGIETLVAELCEQCLFFIWWNERLQQIQFKAIRPLGRDVATVINDTNHVMADTQSLTERPDERITQVHVYHGQKDPTQALAKLWNYQRLVIGFDAQAESALEYGDERVRVITSRWLGASNFQEATKLADRLRARYRDNPKTIKFRLEAKDSALWTGDVVEATIRVLTDFTGVRIPSTLQVLEVAETKPGAEYDYVCEDSFFRGRYGFIAPNTVTADYSVAAESDRELYAFISPDNGIFADGTEAYKII